MIIVFSLGSAINRYQGFPDRELMDGRNLAHSGEIGHEYFLSEFSSAYPFVLFDDLKKYSDIKNNISCFQTKKNIPAEFVVFGDSHAQHLLIGLAESMPGKNIIFCSFGGLPFSLHPQFMDVLNRINIDRSERVFLLAAQWHSRLKELPKDVDSKEAFAATINLLQVSGSKVALVDDVYNFNFDPQRCKFKRPLSDGSVCTSTISLAEEQFSEYMPILYAVQADIKDVFLLEIRKILCVSDTCSMLTEDVMAYRDRHHLSVDGSRLIGSELAIKLLTLK
jgi:hypothetical protein